LATPEVSFSEEAAIDALDDRFRDAKHHPLAGFSVAVF
jgi:hypothetical protein